ncbi:hypothetical protein CCR75_008361 [Bremia lactucae]|uniref:FYVE-type domain-containing protein n=1 Tax=Bremia lactucae TaxID=4779 RepID=A0A976NZI0_BRELC|nr:hypothetical protein CCR75_008361 [Bremia lactucae]
MSSSPRQTRRSSRIDRSSSADLTPSSSSLFWRFQGKKNNAKALNESLASSLPPPRHSHRHLLSRDRKRSTVIYYSGNLVNGFDESKLTTANTSKDVTALTDGEMSDDELPGEDRFDGDAKMPDLAASPGPRDNLARSCGPGSAFMRMSQTFGRASERVDTPPSERRRAVRQSAKYDVTWRQDDESGCCQVCFAMFTKLSRRRHHCRVCGELVCGACSQGQVSLLEKFCTPRRACVACCSLLQAMAQAGDDRVRFVESDMTALMPIKRHKSAPVASTVCPSPTSALMFAPTATPRYRDRLTEVHRVMAAGKLSRNRGSSEKKMYVISSRWLRSWLAFTSSASSTDSICDLDYGFDSESSQMSPMNYDGDCMGCAPGPIENLCLLEVSRGKLVRRRGLIRDEVFAGDGARAGDNADFQLLSPEVWDVFQRLYGGAPSIYVDLTSADPSAWIVDVSGFLTAATNNDGTRIQILPAAERALITRHRSETDLIDLGDSIASRAYTPGSSRNAKQQVPKSPAWTVTSNSSCSSLGEDKECFYSPLDRNKMQFEDLESDVAALSIGLAKTSMDGEEDMRATTSVRSPTAALAASAFAVAMKQARLNAQKAIDDRASRVIAA